MLDLRVNPKTSTVHLCDMRKADRIRIGSTYHDMTETVSFNGTPVLRKLATVQDWPVVGRVTCLSDWQYSPYDYKTCHRVPGWAVYVHFMFSPNAQCLAHYTR